MNLQFEGIDLVLSIDHIAGHTSANHQTISQPQTPSRHHTTSINPSIIPETPRKRKENINQRLRGIKTKLPDMKERIRAILTWRKMMREKMRCRRSSKVIFSFVVPKTSSQYLLSKRSVSAIAIEVLLKSKTFCFREHVFV
jgi:hypothetical protein